MEDAKSWQGVEVTTQLHRTLENHKITLQEWEIWRHTTSLVDAATWIEQGFNPTSAEPWMSHKIFPSEAAFLKGKLPPEEATEWLQAGIKAEQILIRKSLLPDSDVAGAYAKAGFNPTKAAERYDIGATAPEATVFIDGGWNPVTVTNWLHTNRLKYGEINKYIHKAINPTMAIEWRKHKLTATEAIQWASIRIHIDLAVSLRDMKIHASEVNDYLTNGYTLDEALEWTVMKVPLRSAPPPNKLPWTVNCLIATGSRKGWRPN
ncbi:hypothetical protein DSO57_1001721 [Entomophthora muscae]|uniref:Uncharacterized protein n=1 Tax=Entomophthora muscae TaxID=34485 RepID=A0ACC2SLW7_9FUNG|nr:hypothetical protein DSO57_1001721 [Entomophthora muscae]